MNDFNMQSTKRRASLVLERRTSLSLISENAYDEPTVAVMQEDEIACYAPTSSLVDMNMKEYSNNLPPLPQASRRMSLGLSMEDIYDLTGESFDIMAENCTSQELDTIIRHDQQHPLDLENQMNDSLPKQSVVFRRTSLSFMPIHSSDPFNSNFDMEGDDLNLLDASDLQGIWESEDMLASSSSQIVDPYNPLQDPEFAQKYEMQLEGLVKCMKKSSSTRSKVALIKKDLKSKFSYATKKQQQKLAAMGLNKSQDTRKRLLEMGLATSSDLNKVSYCDIKSSRRRRHSPIPVPSSKAFSHSFDPTEFEKQSIRSVSMDVSCFGGYNPGYMNKGGFMPEKVMNRNKFARRRSSLTLQTYQMQFFPDF